ncbi:MAG: hypothetical protein CBB87_01075 [Micavibrio sp. TMED27]|nr:hypothetical protein [Micavibrio sp.]OUT92363.1 MAG: hypothetical protein CBB87_01075 [Micavibrio sp. TMED27]
MTTPYKKAERPRDIANTIGHYLKEGNLDAIVTFFHPDCVICFPPDQPPARGLEGARKAFEPFMESKPNLISTVTHEMIVGDTGVLQADWRIEDDEGNVVAQGNSTEVVKKLDNGGWGYFIDCPLGLPGMQD